MGWFFIVEMEVIFDMIDGVDVFVQCELFFVVVIFCWKVLILVVGWIDWVLCKGVQDVGEY